MSDFRDYSAQEKANVKEQLDEESSFLMKILRGHFLIEDKLNELLNLLVKTPSVWNEQKGPRVDFHTKSYFARSLLPEIDEHKWFWVAVAKLNSTRNKIAHGLESEKLDKCIDDFINHLKNNDSVYKNNIQKLDTPSREDKCVAGISAVYAFFTVLNQKVKDRSVV